MKNLIKENCSKNNNKIKKLKKTSDEIKLKKKIKKQKMIKKRREQYPNRSDYRLLLLIKPIALLHDAYNNFIKLLNYADKAGSIYQFINNKLNNKLNNKKEN